MNSIVDLDIYKNASQKTQNALLENGSIVKIKKGEWTIIAQDGQLKADGMGTTKGGKMTIAPTSALILARVK